MPQEQLFIHCSTFACITFLPSHGLVIWLYYTLYISVSVCVCLFRRQLCPAAAVVVVGCRLFAIAFLVCCCGWYCHCHFCWWLCVREWLSGLQAKRCFQRYYFDSYVWYIVCEVRSNDDSVKASERRLSSVHIEQLKVEDVISVAPIFDHVVYSIDTHIYFDINRHNKFV